MRYELVADGKLIGFIGDVALSDLHSSVGRMPSGLSASITLSIQAPSTSELEQFDARRLPQPAVPETGPVAAAKVDDVPAFLSPAIRATVLAALETYHAEMAGHARDAANAIMAVQGGDR